MKTMGDDIATGGIWVNSMPFSISVGVQEPDSIQLLSESHPQSAP